MGVLFWDLYKNSIILKQFHSVYMHFSSISLVTFLQLLRIEFRGFLSCFYFI